MGRKEESRGLDGDDSKPRVLFVDDEAPLLELYEGRFRSEFDVVTAGGGEEALQVVDERVDFAFIDRRMPEYSGSEVIQALRNEGYEMPVGFLSAVSPESEPAVEHSVYITKPAAREQIQDAVATHVQ